MAARYAVYFAPPPEAGLWQFAAAWLGRDPARGAAVAQPAIEGLTPGQLAHITASPRRYGFHATLKPPFRLAKGVGETDLAMAVKRFAQSYPPFTAPPLQLSSLAGFLALTLSVPCPEMSELAAACVESFEAYRAPATDDELARRRTSDLTPRQDELLARWGYPYVFDQFRFHMTLTGRLDDAERARVYDMLAPRVAAFCSAPLPIDAIVLFRQAEADLPFDIVARSPLGDAR